EPWRLCTPSELFFSRQSVQLAYSMPLLRPVSLQTMGRRGVWYVFLAGALLVAAVVYGLIFYALLMWRKRRDDDGKLPPQFKQNTPIELIGVIIPLLMV